MMHKTRRYYIGETDDLDKLVDDLIERSWTTCTGFRWRSLLILNDSTGPDGAQEYAIVKDGHQVESITVSWGIKPEKLAETLTDLDEDPARHWGEWWGDAYSRCPVDVRTDHPEGSCYACA